MAKKRKKKQLAEVRHDQHHQAIHDYIIRRKVQDGEDVEGVIITGPQHHAMPTHQPWHVPDPACPCFPKSLGLKDPETGVQVWLHSGWIH